MKRLFVSVPMKDRTAEDIKKSIAKMHAIAEVIKEEPLDLIDSYIAEAPETKNERIWYLAKSIEKLAQADLFIGISTSWDWPGCDTERSIAEKYGIESISIPPQYVIDNYDEIMKKRYENESAVCPIPVNVRAND